MGFTKLVENVCRKLGEANLPVYTVAAVAVFKGIFRPTFTMMDKKSNPETKKYAAIKEGSTELVAIPTYIGLSWLTSKFAPAFSPQGKNAQQLLHSTKSTLGFFGVCFAALYAIPKLCNIAMPYIMKAFKAEKNEKQKEPPLDIYSQTRYDVAQTKKTHETNVISPYAQMPINMNGGMKI